MPQDLLLLSALFLRHRWRVQWPLVPGRPNPMASGTCPNPTHWPVVPRSLPHPTTTTNLSVRVPLTNPAPDLPASSDWANRPPHSQCNFSPSRLCGCAAHIPGPFPVLLLALVLLVENKGLAPRHWTTHSAAAGGSWLKAFLGWPTNCPWWWGGGG